MAKKLFALLALVALVVAGCSPSSPPAIRVTAVTPTLNQTDVDVNTVVTTTFGAPITESTLEGAFSLSSEDGPVSGTIAYDSTSRTATFTPDTVLAFETEYTAAWATSLRGANNARLAREYSWVFTTGADPADDPAVTGVTVTPAESEIGTGATVQLTAAVAAVGGADESVTWSSSDAAIATVDTDGLVTAVAPGTATITATSDFAADVSGSATINVAGVTGLTVAPHTLTMQPGDSEAITPTVEALHGADESVTWASDDETVATVDADGLVTAVAGGVATVTATSVADPTFTASVTVNVQTVAVSVSPASEDLIVGGTATFAAAVVTTGGADPSVAWSSDNDAVATVSTTGVVTAVSAGTATITATSAFDTTVSDSATVTVHEALVVDRHVPVTIVAGDLLAESLGVTGGLAPYSYAFTVTAPPGWPADYDGVPYDDVADIGPMTLPPASVMVDTATGTLVGTVAETDIDPETDLGYWAFIIEVTDDIGQVDYVLVELEVDRPEP